MALIMNCNQNLSALLYDRLLQFFILSSAGVWQDMDNTEESGRKKLHTHRCNFKPALILKATNLSSILNVTDIFLVQISFASQ